MPKSPVCFLRAVKFCSTFWHSNWHNFGNILGKVAKLHFLESPQESKRAVEHTIFKFLPFPFFQVSNYCCQKSCNGFRVFLGSSTMSQIFLIYTFFAKKGGPYKFLWNLHRSAFCFFIFSKWKEHCNLPFNDTFKMYCCALY